MPDTHTFEPPQLNFQNSNMFYTFLSIALIVYMLIIHIWVFPFDLVVSSIFNRLFLSSEDVTDLLVCEIENTPFWKWFIPSNDDVCLDDEEYHTPREDPLTLFM